MRLCLFILIAIFTCGLDAWRLFHKGRWVGGNLGRPASKGVRGEFVETQWFTQNLDHFNPTDERTWKQRFFVNKEFFDAEKGGPVFLMIGGEGPASVKWMTQGAWVDYGKRFGALLFQLEHRYYGKSYPTQDLSTENLLYLTSQQALADVANFISSMNDLYKLPNDVKWIAFGGSYPGSLAAWLRFKYPHLVHGAMSASGPLLAEVDFKDYFKVVTASLETFSDDCVRAVKRGIEQVDILLTQKLGQDKLNKIFKLCNPLQESIDKSLDVSNFYEALAGNFAGVVQYNKDNRIGGGKAAAITIDIVCNIMVNQSIGPAVDRLGKVNALLLSTYDQACLDYKYSEMIAEMRNTTWESSVAEGGRQWTYQTCTEFGFYQTSDSQPHIFGDKFPTNFFVQQCQDIFGPKYNSSFLYDAIARTNTFYGGLDIDVTNVVFVHGSIDPWHALGIIKTVNQNAPAIYINGTAHCANMYPKSEKDPPQLRAAREEIAELIDSWLRLESYS